MSITTKIEFDNASAIFCGRMVSLDMDTRKTAAKSAVEMLANLPKSLKNSPHITAEVAALEALISRVAAE